MHILHIANDFPNSSLYKQLALHLDKLGVEQSVYSAVRTKEEVQFNPHELKHLNINVRNILKPYDRIFYRNKLRKIFNNVIENIDFKKVDIIHAHTLYSDGGVALKLKKEFNVPYIVAVRSSDIFLFNKYRLDLRWRRNEILREAEKIIFISPTHRENFINSLSDISITQIKQKAETLPNGLDPYFLDNLSFSHIKTEDTLKLLYVGNFKPRKNVPSIIDAVNLLNKDRKVLLTIVGGSNESRKVKKMIDSDSYPFIEYLGKIEDREKLRQIYAEHDIFVMPSYRETFGLVYIEALSQGVPIIYKEGEGVGGFLESNKVGIGIKNYKNPKEIASKIKDLSNELDNNLQKECIKEANKFNWLKISKNYLDIYHQVNHLL